jgi:hypothetical protein
VRQDFNKPERPVAEAGALFDPPQAAGPNGHLTLGIRGDADIGSDCVINRARCLYLPAYDEIRSLFQIIHLKAGRSWILGLLLRRYHADQIFACEVVLAAVAQMLGPHLRTGVLVGEDLRSIDVAQSDGASVVFEEIVGLLRFCELDLGVADIRNYAPLPVFSPKERMAGKDLDTHHLAYDRQVFAARQAGLPGRLRKVAVKACDNYPSAVLAEEGRPG